MRRKRKNSKRQKKRSDDDDCPTEVLSQDEIDQLLTAINAGDREPEDFRPHADARKIRIYDFKRPDKFSKEQIRTMSIIHETFARLTTTSLSAILRSMAHIHVASVDQLTYEEFIRSIPTPTTLGIIQMDPLHGSAIIEIDPCISFSIIEKLCGGKGEGLKYQHELTDIEMCLMEDVIVRLLGNLRASWDIILDLRPKLMQIDTNPQFAQIVHPTEMVVLVTFESKIEDVEGMINLCIPYKTIESIISRLSAQYWYGQKYTKDQQRVQHAPVNRYTPTDEIPIAMTAELFSRNFPLRAISKFKKDTVIISQRIKPDMPEPIQENHCYLRLGNRRIFQCKLLPNKENLPKQIVIMKIVDDPYETEDKRMGSNGNQTVQNALLDAQMNIQVVLGDAQKCIRDIMEMGEGTIIELDKLAGEPADILANGKLIGKGEIVVIDENFGIRFTETCGNLNLMRKLVPVKEEESSIIPPQVSNWLDGQRERVYRLPMLRGDDKPLSGKEIDQLLVGVDPPVDKMLESVAHVPLKSRTEALDKLYQGTKNQMLSNLSMITGTPVTLKDDKFLCSKYTIIEDRKEIMQGGHSVYQATLNFGIAGNIYTSILNEEACKLLSIMEKTKISAINKIGRITLSEVISQILNCRVLYLRKNTTHSNLASQVEYDQGYWEPRNCFEMTYTLLIGDVEVTLREQIDLDVTNAISRSLGWDGESEMEIDEDDIEDEICEKDKLESIVENPPKDKFEALDRWYQRSKDRVLSNLSMMTGTTVTLKDDKYSYREYQRENAEPLPDEDILYIVSKWGSGIEGRIYTNISKQSAHVLLAAMNNAAFYEIDDLSKVMLSEVVDQSMNCRVMYLRTNTMHANLTTKNERIDFGGENRNCIEVTYTLLINDKELPVKEQIDLSIANTVAKLFGWDGSDVTPHEHQE